MSKPTLESLGPEPTSLVALETSMGVLQMELFGNDCPKSVQNFLGLCATGYYTGAEVTRVVRDTFFEVRQRMLDGQVASKDDGEVNYSFDGLVNAPSPDARMRVEEEGSWVQHNGFFVKSGKRSGVSFPLTQKGLVFLRNDGYPGSASSKLLISCSEGKSLDFMRNQLTLIGRVAPTSMKVVDRVAKTTTVKSRGNGVFDSHHHTNPEAPVRLIRVKHAHVAVPGSTSNEEKVQQAKVAWMSLVAKKLLEAVQQQGGNTVQQTTSETLPLVVKQVGPNPTDVAVVINPHYKPNAATMSSEDDEDEHGHTHGKLGELSAANKEAIRARVDHTRSLMLQIMQNNPAMTGDGDEELQPPENVLFVAKLNPITQAAGLKAFFSQVGKITSCEVVRDWRTGDSLQYGFVEFQTVEMCNRAYEKLQGALVDHCRIHVDFCQSVAGIWAKRKKERAAAKNKGVGRGSGAGGGQAAAGEVFKGEKRLMPQ